MQPYCLWQSPTASLGYRDTSITWWEHRALPIINPHPGGTNPTPSPWWEHGQNPGAATKGGWRSQAGWQGSAAAGSSQGTGRGALYSWTSQGTFGSQCVWAASTQHWELLPKLFSLSQSSIYCYWSTQRGNLPWTSEDSRSNPSNAFISRWRGSEIKE